MGFLLYVNTGGFDQQPVDLDLQYWLLMVLKLEKVVHTMYLHARIQKALSEGVQD